MSQEVWKTIGDVAFYGIAVSSGVFSLMYLFLAPWYRTQAGRNIMAVMGSLACLVVYFAAAIAVGKAPAAYEVRAIGFVALCLAITWRVRILVKEQLLARRERKDKINDPRT